MYYDMQDWESAPEEYIETYSFIDKEQIYTNGLKLIPVFRVEQMLNHYYKERTCQQVITECFDKRMPPFTAHCSECGDQWGYTPNYCPNCGAKVVI